MKGEPEWMRTFRHKSLDYFLRRPMPQWGGDLEPDRLRQHLLLPAGDREAGHLLGRAAWPTSRTPMTAWASPRPRSSA